MQFLHRNERASAAPHSLASDGHAGGKRPESILGNKGTLELAAHDLQPGARELGAVQRTSGQEVISSVEKMFGFAEMSVISFADLYAGKIVAALDRQGIDDALRSAFIVYLLSHKRPLVQKTSPPPLPIASME